MAAIKSDFPSLPGDKDPASRHALAAIASEFKSRGLAFPVAPSRAVALAQLQTVAGALIKRDLEDPAHAALYEGLDDAQAAEVFNATRAGVVFVGVPFCPNAITAEDITAARKG